MKNRALPRALLSSWTRKVSSAISEQGNTAIDPTGAYGVWQRLPEEKD